MSTHRYRQQFEPGGNNSLAVLAEWIPSGVTILELGPAEGYFTRYLHESIHCTVDAVELDSTMAAVAGQWCRKMLVGDLENPDLLSSLPAGEYDIILLADVLEHLKRPEDVLQQLHRLLKTDGRCLISVPNVAYGGLIAGLLGGEFEYRQEGLLDHTHLRFYTRRSLTRLLEDSGWFPSVWRQVRVGFWESEFRTRIETLPPSIADFLSSQPELSCYQWLVEVRPQPVEPPIENEVNSWPAACFPIRLFWADATLPFDYARSRVVWGSIGSEKRVEEFVLDNANGTTKLRLGPSDRPGFMHVYRVDLLGNNGELLWQWLPSRGVDALSESFSGMQIADAGSGALLLIEERDSWLDLAWQGGCNAPVYKVQITVGWPKSADFSAASRAWNAALQPLRLELDTVKALVGVRDGEIAARDSELTARDGLIQELNENLHALQVRLAEMGKEIEALHQAAAAQSAQTATLLEQIARMQTFSWWLKQPLRWLRTKITKL